MARDDKMRETAKDRRTESENEKDVREKRREEDVYRSVKIIR